MTLPILNNSGHYHSLRHGLHEAKDKVEHGLHKAADRIVHSFDHRGGSDHESNHPVHLEHSQGQEIDVISAGSKAAPSRVSSSGGSSSSSKATNTVTIPTHHIRLGDLLILQGRPCQVIRISTSSSTGQHRYLGVDLFTKQLHEESSFISNPSPSVIVQTMLGPIFKQYRVLDLQDGTGLCPLLTFPLAYN